MYPQTHFLFAFLIASVFAKYGVFDYKIVFLIAILAVFMDIDHFIVYALKKHNYSLKDAWNADIGGKYNGRTFIHHYSGFSLVTIIATTLFFLSRTWFWIIALSYYSHIFLDYTKLNILKIKGKITIKELGFKERINKFELLFDIFLMVGIILLLI